MLPVLVELGPFKIHTYGLFLAFAFLLAGWIMTRRANRHGIAENDLTRWITYIIVVSLVGARMYYVLLHPERFAGQWADALAVWKGGLVLHGGILASILFSVFYARRMGWRFAVLLDAVAPALAFGEAVGRIGCFLNGCCYGLPTHGVLGVVFPEGCSAHAAFGDAALHPTQLYLVGLQALVGAALLLLTGRGGFVIGRGALFGAYLMGSSAVRFAVDTLRVYDRGDRFLDLAHSQWIALALGVIGLGMVLRGLRPTQTGQAA